MILVKIVNTSREIWQFVPIVVLIQQQTVSAVMCHVSVVIWHVSCVTSQSLRFLKAKPWRRNICIPCVERSLHGSLLSAGQNLRCSLPSVEMSVQICSAHEWEQWRICTAHGREPYRVLSTHGAHLSFRVQIIAKSATLKLTTIFLFSNHLYLRSLDDLCDHF